MVRQREGAPPTEATHDLPAGSMDVAGATFALRNKGLVVGQEYSTPVFTGSKNFVMRAKVESQQKLKTPLGERDVLKVKVQTDFSERLKTRGRRGGDRRRRTLLRPSRACCGRASLPARGGRTRTVTS